MADTHVEFKAITQVTEETEITEKVDYVFDPEDTGATYTVTYEVVPHGGGGFLRPTSVTKNI